MKRITIGRSTDCDIVINDQTDNVSRRHAVITFDLFGRMTLSDTSSNGTFINDQRMLKGASLPVTREDTVRLGKSWILDWKQIGDPTKSIRRFLFTAAALVFIAIAGVCTYTILQENKSGEEQSEIKQKEEQNDTIWNKEDTQNNRPSDTGIDPNTGEASAKGGATKTGKKASSSKKKASQNQASKSQSQRNRSQSQAPKSPKLPKEQPISNKGNADKGSTSNKPAAPAEKGENNNKFFMH